MVTVLLRKLLYTSNHSAIQHRQCHLHIPVFLHIFLPKHELPPLLKTGFASNQQDCRVLVFFCLDHLLGLHTSSLFSPILFFLPNLLFYLKSPFAGNRCGRMESRIARFGGAVKRSSPGSREILPGGRRRVAVAAPVSKPTGFVRGRPAAAPQKGPRRVGFHPRVGVGDEGVLCPKG